MVWICRKDAVALWKNVDCPHQVLAKPSATKRVFSFSPAAIATLGGLCTLIISSTGVSAKCNDYKLPPAFSIRQSNGFAVTIHVAANGKGDVTGSANYGVPPKVGQIVSGSFDGRGLTFRIGWSGGLTGTYEGSINQNGKLIGVTRGGGSTARFESIQRFQCSS